MGGAESRENGIDDHDRLCGQCSDAGPYQQSFCVKRAQMKRGEFVLSPTSSSQGSNQHVAVNEDQMPTTKEPIQSEAAADDQPTTYYVQQEAPDSWRFHANSDEAVGVGAYFGRLEGQKDSVARVKSLVSGGPAEQSGMIEVLTSAPFHKQSDKPPTSCGSISLGFEGFCRSRQKLLSAIPCCVTSSHLRLANNFHYISW
jgi:hypothetical protein